jgi:pimeloyl-ACP methyl ester carboxylesterase
MLLLVKNLRFFKEVLALGRADAPSKAAVRETGIEAITGRYLNVTVEGRAQRIYFEEAGQGRPVVCLHTAGSDTRQWRHILNDAEITASNRIIAFDMPWHGKSLPPEGFQTEEYLLTTEGYMETVLAVVEGLGLEKPVLAGTSMGGRIALQLAVHHPEAFSGFMAIEASDFQPAWYDIDWFHRPDAHGGEMGAALVSTNITPHAPEAERWNTLWMFQQSGPGVFRGDLSFYTKDDSLLGNLGRIDTTKTPVHMIVGAYDFTCTPEDAKRTADQIPGATLSVMQEVGHFPMSEYPAGFRPYFIEGLAKMPLAQAQAAE